MTRHVASLEAPRKLSPASLAINSQNSVALDGHCLAASRTDLRGEMLDMQVKVFLLPKTNCPFTGIASLRSRP
jgi:hypothetical protein